jgi:ribosomal protein S18 acetylase RimI-like enzyme
MQSANANKTLVMIESMAPGEADAVSRLFSQVVAELPYYNVEAKDSETKQHSPAALRHSVAEDPYSVMVAKADGIVGFCISRYDDGLIWLAWFGVHPLHRHRGIASALLDRLEHTLPERNSHKIWCDSRTNNEPSIKLLSSRCYEQICTVRNHWYGLDFILWEKIIG